VRGVSAEALSGPATDPDACGAAIIGRGIASVGFAAAGAGFAPPGSGLGIAADGTEPGSGLGIAADGTEPGSVLGIAADGTEPGFASDGVVGIRGGAAVNLSLGGGALLADGRRAIRRIPRATSIAC
jgi:hypothetical protein